MSRQYTFANHLVLSKTGNAIRPTIGLSTVTALILLPVFALSAPGPLIRLPPSATVQDTNASGDTWKETGEISGSLEVAHKSFRRVLQQQGWSLRRTIPLKKGAGRSQLCVWQSKRGELLLMLWQKEPGKCGFSWGIH